MMVGVGIFAGGNDSRRCRLRLLVCFVVVNSFWFVVLAWVEKVEGGEERKRSSC